jgi:hypothetical protein
MLVRQLLWHDEFILLHGKKKEEKYTNDPPLLAP